MDPQSVLDRWNAADPDANAQVWATRLAEALREAIRQRDRNRELGLYAFHAVRAALSSSPTHGHLCRAEYALSLLPDNGAIGGLLMGKRADAQKDAQADLAALHQSEDK